MQNSTQKTRRNQLLRRSGFTLLELVAATLLAAMLCVAVMGITANSARQSREIKNQFPARPWLAPLAEQIHWDIVQARSFRVRPDSIELHGFGGRDFTTAVAYHGPTVVTYQIVKDGDVHWLLRKEAHVDDLTSRFFRTEFVCKDVGSIRLSALSGQSDVGRQPADPLQDLLPPMEEQDLQSEGPLPERVVVTMIGQDNQTPILREVICRR